jgi:hypothetical protein
MMIRQPVISFCRPDESSPCRGPHTLCRRTKFLCLISEPLSTINLSGLKVIQTERSRACSGVRICTRHLA